MEKMKRGLTIYFRAIGFLVHNRSLLVLLLKEIFILFFLLTISIISFIFSMHGSSSLPYMFNFLALLSISIAYISMTILDGVFTHKCYKKMTEENKNEKDSLKISFEYKEKMLKWSLFNIILGKYIRAIKKNKKIKKIIEESRWSYILIYEVAAYFIVLSTIIEERKNKKSMIRGINIYRKNLETIFSVQIFSLFFSIIIYSITFLIIIFSVFKYMGSLPRNNFIFNPSIIIIVFSIFIISFLISLNKVLNRTVKCRLYINDKKSVKNFKLPSNKQIKKRKLSKDVRNLLRKNINYKDKRENKNYNVKEGDVFNIINKNKKDSKIEIIEKRNNSVKIRYNKNIKYMSERKIIKKLKKEDRKNNSNVTKIKGI